MPPHIEPSYGRRSVDQVAPPSVERNAVPASAAMISVFPARGEDAR